MGFFKSLFYDGKKCYYCGRCDTEWVGSRDDLSAFPASIADGLAAQAATVVSHYGRKYDIYFCNRCKHYIIDFPSTSSIRGTQSAVSFGGRRVDNK